MSLSFMLLYYECVTYQALYALYNNKQLIDSTPPIVWSTCFAVDVSDNDTAQP